MKTIDLYRSIVLKSHKSILWAQTNERTDGQTVRFYYAPQILFGGIKKATEPQLHRTVLNRFAIFKNIAHTLEPGETPSNSASHQAPNYVQHS